MPIVSKKSRTLLSRFRIPAMFGIRSTVLDFIQGACDNMRNKKLIENSAMEGLYAIFARDNIDEEEKNRICILIVNIVEPRIQPTCAE